MASSDSEGSIGREIEDEKSHAYIHIRVDRNLKDDLQAHARKENTSITTLITSLVEDLLYKRDDDEDEEEDDELLDLVISSLMNLERRMEIRLATLHDTFNSLIGRLIDSQNTLRSASSAQLRKKKKGEILDTDDDELVDLSDVLSVDKEEEIYARVKRYLQQQGKVIDANTVLQQIENDRVLKEYLAEQDRQSVGLKLALITDAIQEAAYELGYPTLESI
jgi:hypothetical protein